MITEHIILRGDTRVKVTISISRKEGDFKVLEKMFNFFCEFFSRIGRKFNVWLKIIAGPMCCPS